MTAHDPEVDSEVAPEVASEVTSSPKRCRWLVVDSAGFIRNAPLRSLGERVVTLREVVAEIRDRATRQRLQVLPYELEFGQPDAEDVKHVSDFAKKTGDYPSLSATDIKVLALALRLEREANGGSIAHLRSEPVAARSDVRVNWYTPGQPSQSDSAVTDKLPGFYMPGEGDDEDDEEEESEEEVEDDERFGEEDDAFSAFNFWRDPLPDIALPTFSLDQDSVESLNRYFAMRSYCVGYQVSAADFSLSDRLKDELIVSEKHPHLCRYVRHVSTFERSNTLGKGVIDSVVESIVGLGKAADERIVHKLTELTTKEEQDGDAAKIVDKVEAGENGDKIKVVDKVGEEEEQDHIKATDAEDVEQEDEAHVKDDADLEQEDGDHVKDDADEDQTGDCDDDDGWITPANLTRKKRLMRNGGGDVDGSKFVDVACLTTDFAMQNVLRQMGMEVVSADGVLIRSTRTWLRRCYACFATTADVTRRFCPRCGNATLKRVACTRDADGNMQIHISSRRKLTGRGKRFPLPAPTGGKHAVNPVLCEDQPAPQQRLSKAARRRTQAMDDDYTSGSSPFALRDTTSRSAMLGVQTQHQPGSGAYWNRRNPNAGAKKTGNRRKKNAV